MKLEKILDKLGSLEKNSFIKIRTRNNINERSKVEYQVDLTERITGLRIKN